LAKFFCAFRLGLGLAFVFGEAFLFFLFGFFLFG
jgi:hypothetical protein